MRWQIEPMPAWPYEETKQRRNSTFGASWSSTLDLLDRELYYLDVDGPVAVRVVGSPADVRRDGMLRATARLEHPGVAVSFTSKRRGPLTFPCDTFVAGSGSLSSWQANVRAIALGLEALRKVDRYGIAGRGEQYAGWRAIEASPSKPAFASAPEAREWLRDLVATEDGVNDASLLRLGAREAHPDRNGGKRDLWDLYDAARQLIDGGTR
jgi:hypothetical protein